MLLARFSGFIGSFFSYTNFLKRQRFLSTSLLTTTLLLSPITQASITPEAGVTPGEFTVDQSGSANYQMPISVPPGSAGMQPSLSLAYNSNTGNGLMGMGWSMGGLSAISHCPTTKVQDGFIDGVDFDNNDRFCLDGQRLIAISGIYGANGTEYRTEQDGQSKIVSYGTQANGPSHFKVWTKSGQILEYGHTADSKIEAQGKTDVRLWSVNKISDTVGNYLTFEYAENNSKGSYHPIEINYTGNSSTGLNPYNKVIFEYETRADISTIYFAGSKVETSKRLTHIKTYSGTDLIRDYQLTYDNQGAANFSRLTQVQECEGGGACFPAVGFEWENEVSNSFIPATGGQLHTSNFGTHDAYSKSASDVNGDGITDLIWMYSGPSGFHAYTAIGQGDGSFQPATGGQLHTSSFGTHDAYSKSAGDVNGDGITDLIWMYSGPSGFHAYTALEPKNTLNGMLLSITDSQGNETEISYAPLTNTDGDVYTKGTGANYPEIDIQGASYVVSSVMVDDGVGGQRETTYTYEGLRSSYERGSQGFASMTSRDVTLGISTKTDYLQDYPYAGQVVRSTQTYDSGTPSDATDDILLSETDSTYGVMQTHNGIETVSGVNTQFVYPVTITKKGYELTGQHISTTTTTNTYDVYANVLDITVSVSGLDYNGVMETFTTQTVNTYNNNTSLWHLGRLTRADVTQTLPDNTSESRASAFSYDSSTGLLIQEIVEPDNTNLKLTTSTQYDGYGNKISVTISDNGGNSRTTTNVYDAKSQFAVSTSNAAGHSETRVYEPKFGNMTSLTGPNGLTTTWSYDNFGRVLNETRADGTQTLTTRQWCQGFLGYTGNTGCPTGAALALITQTTGSPTTAAYSDTLGRVIRSATVSRDGQLIYSDTQYNARGEIEKKADLTLQGTPSSGVPSTMTR